MRVGASASIFCRSDQSRVVRDAPRRVPVRSSASSRVLPVSAGLSQSSSVAISALSDRSGKALSPCASSGIHARRQRTRARHCASDSVHGNASSPSWRTASTSASAKRAGSGLASGRLSSTMRSKRRFAHGRDARGPAVPDHAVFGDEALRGIRARRRCSSSGAARSTRASRAIVAQFADDDPRLAVQRAVVEQFRAAAVGQLVAVRIAGMLARDAVGEGVQQQVAEQVRAGACVGGARVETQAAPPLPRGLVDRGQRERDASGGDAAVAERGQRLPALGQCVAACLPGNGAADRALPPAPPDRRPARARRRRLAPAASRPAADACPAPACAGRGA